MTNPLKTYSMALLFTGGLAASSTVAQASDSVSFLQMLSI